MGGWACWLALLALGAAAGGGWALGDLPDARGRSPGFQAPSTPEAAALRELPQPPEGAGLAGLAEAAHAHSQVYAWRDSFFKQRARRPIGVPGQPPAKALDQRLFAGKDTCGVEGSRRPVARENLVLVAVGDEFDASKWMDHPELANWDLIVVYYGKQHNNYSCPLCAAVYLGRGPKWRLAYRFTLLEEWEQYRQQYKSIMLADDDLILKGCTFNSVFTALQAYNLLMAQPSLCRAKWSYSPYRNLFQDDKNVLRYVSAVEIMAPAFRMDFFDSFVRPTLRNAWSGWGLEHVWSFLLNYPRDKVAVVDAVCMWHPPSVPGKVGSVYDAGMPFSNKEEEARLFSEYGYTEFAAKQLGLSELAAVDVLGHVPKARRRESFLETAHKIFQLRLGLLYPFLLLAQTLVILVATAVFFTGFLARRSSLSVQQRLLAMKASFSPRQRSVSGKLEP